MAITLDVTEIKKILPHRFPMLLVDRILDLEPMKWAVGVKNISVNEMQFLGHFPENPIMPGVLMIEAMAQVGGVALLYPPENRGKIAVFAKIDKVRFHKQIVPGDQVITRAEVIKIHGVMAVIHCEGKVDGELACECDCFFAIQ
ncbi:MAG: 3-hydroxyacyl-ACP dehydratase FabZ [Acidaminococcaceae bacterium]|nr:3-hydroxyacyl-ACP dehydratase FabZ [Acidaminococcaceae bacterium]MBO5603985.1 3-hydroxyacyl-ACP dehydratase FabZ [Acidaminococcaceae bacterium]MBQ5345043.1 3-hydroxyacyl-ACP dehydratase FabZ [Acidaminococcaceae bacterium]